MKGRIINNQSAKARSPTRRISSITDFQEGLDTVVDVIDDVSDHDPDISKAIGPCSLITVYMRDSAPKTSFQAFGGMVFDLAMNMGDLAETYDDGSYQNCLTKKDLKLRIWS